MALAERAGLDLDQVAAAIASGQAASPQVVRNSARMADGDHAHNIVFSGRLRRKDAAYGVRLADTLGLGAPFGQAALNGLDALLAAGLGDRNESSIIEVARQARPGPPTGAVRRSRRRRTARPAGPSGSPAASAFMPPHSRSRDSRSSMCAVWLSCARSAAILVSNLSVTSTAWLLSGCAISQVSAAAHSASSSSASSVGCANGLRASG